jgi:acid stress-induced BolA-like protein IbaG/YrbA
MENNDIKEIMEASTVVEKLEVSGNSVLVLQQKD